MFFINDECDVRVGDVFPDVRKKEMFIRYMGKVCFCKNKEQAFFISSVLNGHKLGAISSIKLPWKTDESNEFVYDCDGNVVTRIDINGSLLFENALEHFYSIEERKASLLIRKIQQMYGYN